jgi:transcriptional regulator GlxA family with amidase domain
MENVKVEKNSFFFKGTKNILAESARSEIVQSESRLAQVAIQCGRSHNNAFTHSFLSFFLKYVLHDEKYFLY